MMPFNSSTDFSPIMDQDLPEPV
eukprot:COSAG04_NODE_11960_length_678_cov_0.670121_1_plen_22_part_10